jgi:cysteinyl-tRNA synthetase
MGLKLFNTLARQKEDFVSIEQGKVRIYTCGSTVYDYAHIGNFRAFMVADLLRKYLKYKGYQVIQVLNLTDVDDKTIKRSQEKKISLQEFTKKYKEALFQDIRSLNIEAVEVYPEATTHIEDMVNLAKKLLEKGYAYQVGGSTYFKISSFPSYGKLSKMKMEGLKAGARVKQDQYEKEEIADFVLWKGWDEKDGEVYWETEIGKGRPGWHIECSAMSMRYLGKHFDIHLGGVDLIFPHHENEIAQSEAASGEKFVNYWMHNEMLMVEGKKMAKSFGNYYTLRDLVEKGHNPIAIRYLLLATHYRQQLNFTFEGLDGAKNALQRLYDFMDRLKSIKSQKSHPEVAEILKEAQKGFEESLDDDLNTSSALGKIFDLVKEINRFIDEGDFSSQDAEKTLDLMQRFDSVLGILKREELKLDEKVTELIRERNQARKEKKWEEADKVRKEIESLGIILEDTPEGTKWKKRT